MPISLQTLPLEEVYLDQLIAAVRYESTIGSLLHSLKYKHGADIAEFCADFLFCTTDFPVTNDISAVPIHAGRKAERGFNQSELIAQRLSELTHIPYTQFLEKKRKTVTQASLKNQSERLQNLENAISLKKFIHGSKDRTLSGSVLLIDDVCTTGATLNTCAKILKKHGVETVIGLTVAHGF